MKRNTLLPQGVVLIQHIEIRPSVLNPVEHLDACWLAQWQQVREVVVLQGIAVQV
ncbi:hypothetical protein D3C72_2227100 [compost metagenome]